MNKTKATVKQRCVYCMADQTVVDYSVRTIPGYVNPLTGKNTAFVEKMACGHELVDGKFNVDALYFSAPRQPETPMPKKQEPVIPEERIQSIPINHIHRKNHSKFNIMDGMCLVCLVFLAFAMPPLTVLPILYFIGRMK